MKNKLVSLGLGFVCSTFLLQAQDQPALTFSTVNQIRVKEQIDTIIIFDPARLIETVKILKYKNISLDLNNCKELSSDVSLGMIQLTANELLNCEGIGVVCKPLGQLEYWTIQSFSMAIQVKGQGLTKLTNKGSKFNEPLKLALQNLQAGSTIYFEDIQLEIPGIPVVRLSFGVDVN